MYTGRNMMGHDAAGAGTRDDARGAQGTNVARVQRLQNGIFGPNCEPGKNPANLFLYFVFAASLGQMLGTRNIKKKSLL